MPNQEHERERDQTHSYWYIPSALRENYSLSSSWRAPGWWRWPPERDSPLRQGAVTGLDWFSVATQAYGGGTPDLGFFLEVSVYIRGFGVENKSGGLRAVHKVGRHAPTLVGSPWLFWPNSFTPWPSSGPKISSVKFQVHSTPFGFPFLRYSKTRKKQKLALGSRLIG